MTRAVEQIERDIAAIQQATSAIAQEFLLTYSHYATLLGQAIRQQLVLAAYHICTQGYPEAFLKLSLNQRQDLQQDLRRLAQQAQTQLADSIQTLTTQPPTVDQPHSEALETAATPLTENSKPAPPNRSLPPTPTALIAWHDNLEEEIAELLQTLSHQANRSLQQFEILPGKLPEPVLEVAAKAGDAAAVGQPNILNLIVETDTSNDDAEAKVTHIMAIRLRLVEIEFADAALTAWRTKIRNLASRITQLGRDFQKKQREKAIATAAAAWRASWFED
jgi:hypothetical protein